jgi:hypothetical protein
MLVLGVGLGLVMQVIVLVVQNDAPPEHIGAATSTATFFRSMGGSIGVALFGAIFAWRLDSTLAAIPHAVAAHMPHGAQISPGQVKALPPAAQHLFMDAFVNALQPVFVAGAVLTGLTFLLALALKEVPLRATTHMGAQLEAEEAVAGATPPVEIFG